MGRDMLKSTHSADEALNLDFSSSERRTQLAQIVMQLFEKWQLDTASQLNLLGLSETSRALLSKYRKGLRPLANNRDVLDRVGWLLAIHKALRLLYPYNEKLRYGWIKLHNRAFNQNTPLELMREQGLLGVATVARYLDFQRGR